MYIYHFLFFFKTSWPKYIVNILVTNCVVQSFLLQLVDALRYVNLLYFALIIIVIRGIVIKILNLESWSFQLYKNNEAQIGQKLRTSSGSEWKKVKMSQLKLYRNLLPDKQWIRTELYCIIYKIILLFKIGNQKIDLFSLWARTAREDKHQISTFGYTAVTS